MSYFEKRPRMAYLLIFLILLLIEIVIALFVRDDFIRPYIGDFLVTILICSLARVVFLMRVKFLPFWVLLLAFAVETAQYFHISSLPFFESVPYLKIIIGNTFSVADLFCYALGCLVFFFAEKTII